MKTAPTTPAGPPLSAGASTPVAGAGPGEPAAEEAPVAPPLAAPRAMVVVPTYNEADNLEALLRELLAHDGFHVLVVDDASTDGTGEIAERASRHDPRVRTLHRPRKLGLGTAYLAGFRQALAAGAERVVQMDADFSHSPADTERLLAALDEGPGADLVIGSRYTAGGSIVGWGPARHALSRGGNLYACLLLGFRVRDWTAGFKAFRPEAVRHLLSYGTYAEGYAFQVQTAYRSIRAGLRLREIPIVFRDRTRGQSKMGNTIIREAMLAVLKLRFEKRRG